MKGDEPNEYGPGNQRLKELAGARTPQGELRADQAQGQTERAEMQTTQAENSEREMFASEVSYRRLFEAAQDGILILDAETGRINDVNPFLFNLLGFSRDEMIGKTVGDLSPFKDIVSNQAMLERVQQHGYVRYEDLPMETRDGRRIAVEFVSNVYQAGSRKVIQCNIRDITERKRAEIASMRLAAIIEFSDDAIIGTDPNSIITSWNRGAEKIFGYTVSEMVGTSILRLIPADRPDEEDQILGKLRQGEKVEHLETVRQTKDGRLIDISITASPIRDASGKVIGVSKVARDITERRKMESKFHQAQKMESIGLLAGGIAHDFNNILSAIVGNVYLAKMDAAEDLPVADYLESILVATQRAADLVNQILTFSRQSKQEREPITLKRVVLEALKLLRASVPATIRIQTELADTPTVLANATAVHQVVMNLGTNAWHAMRDKPGTLKVVMSRMEVDEDSVKSHPDLRPGHYVRLSISDTGCGMNRAIRERIFEPFFTTKAVGEGTGLGLAVVHGIMKSHDGGISVYSQPGEGTIFHLYFPVFETEAVIREIESAPIPQGQGEHILFVDDEEALASVGKKVLERLGYVVTTKTGVLEALAAVRDHPEQFDLVITDLTMPVMDGTKLGSQLLQIQPRLAIILATGYSGIMTTEKARELGFRELISKPITARILGEAVHRVLHPAAATDPGLNG